MLQAIPKPFVFGLTSPGELRALLRPGELLECGFRDAEGSYIGTALLWLSGVHPSDQFGTYVEAHYMGASDPVLDTNLAAHFAANAAGPAIHICQVQMALCQQYMQWPGRCVIHCDTIRQREMASLTEQWIPAHLLQAAATARMQLMMAPHAQTPPGPLGGAPPPDAGTPLGADAPVADKPPEADKVKSMEAKVLELRERLRKRKSVQGLLLDNAEEAAKKEKKKKDKKKKDKKKKGDDSASSSRSSRSSFLGAAPSRHKGQMIPRFARDNKGELFKAGMEQVKAHLLGRGGATEDDVETMQAKMVTYLTAIWQGAHPVDKMGPRNTKELRLLAECIDLLLMGDLSALGDTLMQEFKATQQSITDGHWGTAQHLSLIDSKDRGLATDGELTAASSAQIHSSKLTEAVNKSRGSHH
jgi:hypothetical protein